MPTAQSAREALCAHPMLESALRAGVLNYAAAARFLDVDGAPEAVATALRRYEDELPAFETQAADARVRMQSGVGLADSEEDALLSVGGSSVVPDSGSRTAILATGTLDAHALSGVLGRLLVEDIEVAAAGVCRADSEHSTPDTLLVVVEQSAGPGALRSVEAALERVPT